MEKKYELIVAIVNRGFAETAMEGARNAGATGGTVVNAKGTANKGIEAMFGLTVQPEKEAVLIVVPKEKRNAVMSAVVKNAGLNTEGKGIAFSVPVEETAGLNAVIDGTDEEKKTDEAAPEAKPRDEA